MVATATTSSMSVSQSSSEHLSTDTDGNEPIKVVVRLRPLNSNELSIAPTKHRSRAVSFRSKDKDNSDATFRAWSVLQASNTSCIVQKSARKVEGKSIFSFDSIFDETTTTNDIYKSMGSPIVKNLLEGRHGTIFAYGQTGAGKTYTMQGNDVADNDGIIQMVANDIFRSVDLQKSERQFLIRVSFIEIYNENVYDLLHKKQKPFLTNTNHESQASIHKCQASTSAHQRENKLTNIECSVLPVRVGPKRAEAFVNSTEISVENADTMIEILRIGNMKRRFSSTKTNNRSSRGHAIFKITMESREKHVSKGTNSDNTSSEKDNQNPSISGETPIVRKSVLNLVDLAGSESTGKPHNGNTRQSREGANINKSLLALSQVINALSSPPNKRPAFINYRNSKLTRLLQPYLSGNSLMTILCCASASRLFLEETRSTLKFAARAKLIHTDAIINEVVDKGVQMKRLQKELAEIRHTMANLVEREESSGKASAESEREIRRLKSIIIGGDEELPEFLSLKRNYRLYNGDSHDQQFYSQSHYSAQTPNVAIHKHKNTNGSTKTSPLRNTKALKIVDENVDPRIIPNHTRSEIKHRYLHPSDQQKDVDTTATQMSNLTEEEMPLSETIILKDGATFTGSWQSEPGALVCQTEERVKFLESKLEITKDLVDSLFIDLYNAKKHIHLLVHTNASLSSKVAKLILSLDGDEEEATSLLKQQIILLKYSMYMGIICVIFDKHTLFFVALMFAWLSVKSVT